VTPRYDQRETALGVGECNLDPEVIDHLVEGNRLRMEAARRLRMEARRASTVLPPPNPLLAATIDGEPPVPLA